MTTDISVMYGSEKVKALSIMLTMLTAWISVREIMRIIIFQDVDDILRYETPENINTKVRSIVS